MKFLTNIVPVTITRPSLAVVMVFGLAAAAWAQPERVLVPSGSFHSVMPEVKGEAVPKIARRVEGLNQPMEETAVVINNMNKEKKQ